MVSRFIGNVPRADAVSIRMYANHACNHRDGRNVPAGVLLIERDLFFGEVEIGDAQLSPDGKFMTFLRPYKGVRNIWVKKAG